MSYYRGRDHGDPSEQRDRRHGQSRQNDMIDRDRSFQQGRGSPNRNQPLYYDRDQDSSYGGRNAQDSWFESGRRDESQWYPHQEYRQQHLPRETWNDSDEHMRSRYGKSWQSDYSNAQRDGSRQPEYYDTDPYSDRSNAQYDESLGDQSGYGYGHGYGHYLQQKQTEERWNEALKSKMLPRDDASSSTQSIQDSGAASRVAQISKTQREAKRTSHAAVKSPEAREAWPLTSALDTYVLPTPSEVLLLLDTLGRPLCASAELAQILTSLEDPQWSDRDFSGKVRGVITASKDGRWFAVVICHNEKTAKNLKWSLESKIKDVAIEFVEQDAIDQSVGKKSWSLCDEVHQSLTEAGALIDACDPRKAALPTHPQEETLDAENSFVTAEKPIAFSLQSVAKDHRKMAGLPNTNKLAPAHISRWNAQRATLGEGANTGTSSDSKETGASASVSREDIRSQAKGPANNFDYTDDVRKACLLCQRQFKAIEVLRRHVTESDLHKRNLEDTEACQAGRRRKGEQAGNGEAKQSNMKPAGFAPVKESDDDTAAKYRDRAMERRVVFGADKVAKAKARASTGEKGINAASSEGPKPSSPPPEPVKLDESSIGGALLAKMGWTSGQGLGTSGEGRTAPVDAHLYERGAGLGSSRGPPPPTVEEHSAKRARLQLGGAALEKTERMRDRYDTQ